MRSFSPGDKVKMWISSFPTSYYEEEDSGYYIYGEVTIVRENDCKVLFDGDRALSYDYYLKKDLELDN